MKPLEEESDALDALGTLATFASQQQSIAEGDEANEAVDEDDDDQPFTRKPFTRTMQKQERDALQKWVQCAKCAKWRKVPYSLKNEEIPEDWECRDNKWDRMYAACTMAQALTDEEIDGILNGQKSLQPPAERETADADTAEAAQLLEGGKQAPNRSRPTRNKTKKVIGGATDEEIAEHAARPRMPRPTAVRQLQRNRSKGKNGKMRVGSKHINDAAEALLGMGSGFVDDDTLMDDDGDELGDEMELGFPPGSFRPGRVVWAKVDGHEWWPAKVVRRRAVPREVGPPPGGPALVHTQIPVVFFTQAGVPGEAADMGASSQGLAAVCTQAMDHLGDESRLDSDEAEYAWLSLDSLKPFREGDSLTADDENHVSDPTLTACIAAAERAVKAAADRPVAAAADAEHEGEEDDGAESLSDSDGGWGYTHTDALGTPRAKGRHRPAKPRKGRALKGNKRAKGKSGRGGWEDEEDVNGIEAPLVNPYGQPPGVPLPAPVVEGLFGWRWPLTAQELARDAGKLHNEQEGLEPAASHDAEQAKAEPVDDSPAHGSSQHDGLQQEEAEAVAALMAAASGLGSEDQHPASSEKEAEYLVKWIGKAHIHNEWVPEPLLLRIAKRKVINFKRRYGSQPCMLMEQAWTQPCTFICRRSCLSGPGWEVLVKWCHLGYEHATWEIEGEGPLAQSQNQQLHRQLLQRQREALLRSQPEAVEAAAAAKKAASTQLSKFEEQPDWIEQGQLYPHQLAAITWLRQQWVRGVNAVLADDKGLGRTATVITFLQCLRNEFHSPRPVLLATQGSELRMWEGEWEFWGQQGLHVVSYNGSAAARNVIAEHELWLAPGCLDGRAPKRVTADMPHKVVQPDVVLASFDALAGDISHLQPIEWEAIVVDERCTVQLNLVKAHQALREVESNFRLLLPSGNPTLAPYDTLVQSLSYLDPEAVPDQDLDEPAQQHHEQDIRQAIEAHMLRRLRSQVSSFSPPTAEVVLPVMMTQQQRECYQAQLARAYEILTDPKTPRQNSHRGGQLRMVCSSLKKVCDHPFLLPDYESAAASGWQDALLASGKMVVLDKLLHHLQAHAHKILLLSHHPQVLEMLAVHCRQSMQDLVLEHIEASASAAARHAAITRFNACNSAGVLLMSTKSCGLGTDLPSISAVVLHDSDWNPRWDMQALSMAHCIGRPHQPVPVYRLVTKGTMEERVHQLVDKKKGSELIFKSSVSKSSPAAVHIMEDALRWGVEHIFSRQPYTTQPQSQDTTAPTAAASPHSHVDTKMEDAHSPRSPGHMAQEAGMAAAESTPSPRGKPPSASPEPSMKSPFGSPEQQQQQPKSHSKLSATNSSSVFQPVYTDTVVEKVVEWSVAQSQQAQARGEGVDKGLVDGGAGVGSQSLEEVLGPGWSCVKLHEWQQGQLDDNAQADAEEEDVHDDLECAELDLGDDSMSRSEHSGSTAKFWEGLLKERHQQLLKEEEQQVREQWRSHHLHPPDVSPALDPAEEAGGHDYNDEAEEEEGLGPRQSSGISHLPEYGGEDAEGNRSRKRRPMKGGGSGRAVAKGNRRRRLDEEDEQAEEQRVNRKRKRGMHHQSGRLAVDRAEYEAQVREKQHQDDVMRRLADPSTPEGVVAHKAYRRIAELLEELKLDEGHLELATQTAEILMILRPESEPISDFQDYTLVAVIAVASHLMGSHAGDHHFLAALAMRFSQDATALHQVFEYIITTVVRFRHGNARMIAVLGDQGASHRAHSAGLHDAAPHQGGDSLLLRVDSDQPVSHPGPGSAEHQHHAVPQPPSVIMNSDMEAFGNRLSAIVNADFYAAALAVGPVDVPLGPLQALSAHLPVDNSAQAQHTEEILKQLRQMQEQVALFDRIHNIRVKHIQEEYQKYMERVRSKAQSAIDQANANYQHHRAMLTARVDTMVHYLQQQYLRGPTGTYSQEGDRLQQLQQQQLQQQQQQQRVVDVEVVRGSVASSSSPSPHTAAPLLAELEGAAERAASEPPQDLSGVEAEGRQPMGSTSTEHGPPQHLTDLPLHHPSRPQDADPTAASQTPNTSASGMSLQPPSLPAPFHQQQQQQQQQAMPAQLVPGSAQAQQQHQQAAAAAAAAATGSPREAGLVGVAGQKQAPKPPLAPGSKGVPQPMLLARQLKQPAQHLPLKGLSPQQQSQVLSQYNHDQQRATAPLSAMRRAGPVVLAGHPTREAPAQTVHAIFQQGGLQQAPPKSKLGSGGAGSNPTPLASLVTSQAHPHSYPHGYTTVQSGAPSMVPPTHPNPIQTGPAGDTFPSGQTSPQLRSSREISPSTEIRINGEAGSSTPQQASPAGGAASYGASTMGITIQPSQPAPTAAHSDDDSMSELSPLRLHSPAREAAVATASTATVQDQAQQSPLDAHATAAAAASGLSKQQAVLTPHRVSMLRGGPVAGAYIDGRQVTTGSGELPAHIGHGFEPEDRFGRGSARKEASRYAGLSASSKPDSTAARSMHASPSARLIITSGGSSRDGPTARAASGDLLRADSEPNRAQRASSISLVTAPDLSQISASERPLQRAVPSQVPAEQPVAGTLPDAVLGPSRALSQSQAQPNAEAQRPSPNPKYSHQPTLSLPSQQHGSGAGQVQAPFPTRVDSLSRWGRQGDPQQRSGSPQA